MANDLDWLATATPKPAEFKASKRGRQPGTNPMEVHVKAAFENGGKPLQLSVPAASAKKAERLMRRAAIKAKYSLSVQVWDADGAVIPLKDIDNLPEGTDVSLVFSATLPTEKEAKPEDKPVSETDPFAETPTAPVEDEKPNGKTSRKTAVTAGK